MPPNPTTKPFAPGYWYTLQETAWLCSRAPHTIANLITQHQLPRKRIREGRHPRRIMLLSYDTVQRLRRLTIQA